ncbi:MAG: hypothetical protein Q4C65_02545 [Eubacteriales bacterium]|nr:hypothetical protein [Eubacteriales bacterium]
MIVNYSTEYQAGYRAGMEQFKRNRKRRIYFITQKLTGLLLLGITGAMILLVKDGTVAFVTLPIAGLLLFSKEMCLINKYYWEVKEGGRNEF